MSDAQFITMALRIVNFSAMKNNRRALEISEANKVFAVQARGPKFKPRSCLKALACRGLSIAQRLE